MNNMNVQIEDMVCSLMNYELIYALSSHTLIYEESSIFAKRINKDG